MYSKKRAVEIVVLSDVHLGTYGCHAVELLDYLKTIKPKILILNGDIIDIWQFRKSYFPKSHLKIIKKILDFTSKGTKVYYLTGNHDEMLRKFSDTKMGNFEILDKLVLELDGKKAWFFHGDIFDNSVHHAKWIAKLGGIGYDYLILLNRFINWCLVKVGKEPYSLSKKVKASVKKAVKFISDFETTTADLAIDNQYDFVVCGHIHEPKIEERKNKKGVTTYMNSGDWIENLTALEYNKKRWKLYQYEKRVLIDDEKEYFEFEEKLCEQLMISNILTKK
ncbi:ser/Thr protein phosphatase family protein, UDP-2,3-diacylglucosamine hydrolase-like protein [Flavobacterium cauense R2A-7]|uniref:UDP-2,3-diacylglucosamine pyrophosphatase LpxH n=1 Tax=Flavobacterium cauense R2A-7 TaxID=1341154 RepID=V6RW96_9FLAO|nr:UDP-2,3-diacylglucosamine diphosphatase [Flavobacterium cauense]ESU18753.1 ser/Thr protein phosphatase family protein, UDP-2,3-diacylglucosamine hydrolase-like protein [Flavobacterium cauense R2A-7]KGO81772.1 phosphoesterase [Flavobacterium cauense R2A-7]TWI13805.1 UDP-2,3-diacylglucosamine pyrophosphatase LpxH [Flavobacterium cauense R2A-7]